MHSLTRGGLRGGVLAGVLLWAGVNASAQDLSWYWKDSLRAETEDGDIKFRLGGRIHVDAAVVDQSRDNEMAVGKFEDGAEFRRARLYLQGELGEDLEFKFQYDFAGGDADFKDVYGGWRTEAVGTIIVGQSKEPYGLEQLTSSNDITFMERSLAQAFNPDRSTGIVIGRPILDNRMTWRVGVFRSMTDSFGDAQGNGDNAITGRITGTPIYEDEGDFVIHLGGDVSLRGANDVRFRYDPESHLGPDYVDTGTIPCDQVLLYGVEAACVLDALCVQGEYHMAAVDVDAAGASDVDFSGHYIEASYALTGETRPYDPKSAAFKFLKPARNFGDGDGCGAWVVAVRYSGIDLNDGAVNGGELRNWTLGLNWHLNPNSRVMLNYVRADLSDLSGTPTDTDNIFQVRFQLMF